MPDRRPVLPIVLAALAAACFALAASPALATFPGRNGVIAVGGSGMQLACERSWNIHVLRANGTHVAPLTASGTCRSHFRYGPDWFAGGASLLYTTAGSLGVMTADGVPVRRVRLPFPDGAQPEIVQPSVAPDGQRAVFDAFDEEMGLWLTGLDGTGLDFLRPGSAPRWSPDGRTIAYVTPRSGVGVLDVAREQVVARRRFAREVVSVDWAPDGSRLLAVLLSTGRKPRFSLAAIAVSTTVGRPVTIELPRSFERGGWWPVDAVWSPDQRRIAFIAYRAVKGNPDAVRASLWVMDARGGHVDRVRMGARTGDGALPDHVSWQPLPGG